MTIYYDAGNFKKVIEISKDAEKLSLETDDYEILSNTYRLRASSFTELGFNDDSHKEFLKALTVADKIESKNYKFYQKSLIYIGIASYNAHISAPLDSVIYYQTKSLETTIKMDDSEDFLNKKYHNLTLGYINLGMTSIASKKVKDAEMYFFKALQICKNTKYHVGKDLEVTTLNEFAWLYYDQKKYDKTINYAVEAEKLERQISKPYIRRDIYEVLFKAQVEMGKKEESSKYMNLYTSLNDSLVNAEKKTINTPARHMIDEQGKINKSNIQKIIIISSLLIILIIILGCFFWRRNKILLHGKYEIIIESLKNKEEEKPKTINNLDSTKINRDNSVHITSKTSAVLFEKLSKFEEDQEFIRGDISRVYLANSLNTNTKYLSEIIKQHTGKSFNNYINGLRINYITELLYKEPKYREYKISYLAEVCGFASREVFATVFKKETGVTPSYFISQLKADNVEQEL
ncbi:helix-turn-helix transcriptional regulator [Elizabethkingia anophelis]|nr:helix-turn-helix transcriptional regulator [Elizabethkingia anophelis]